MLNENTFLIEKKQHELTQDLDQLLSFQDLSEEEQNEICENIASEEYENIDDYDIAENELIYEKASKKMGYLREYTLKEDCENLQYNLSYSHGVHAYLMGNYNLQTLLKNNGASKQLLKDLNYLLKMSNNAWEKNANDSDLDNFIDLKNNCFYITRECGFYNKSIGGGNHIQTANLQIEEFFDALKGFSLKNGCNPACVKRILEELEKNIIETAFENFEHNLRRELHDYIYELKEMQQKTK